MKRLYRLGVMLLWLLAGLHIPAALYAQRESYNWYFGTQAGVTFNSGSPVALVNGQLSSYEACASVSTPAGDLVMYSDGERVWDASHQLMPNGIGLGGHTSSVQGALVLRHPGNPMQYFIFAVDAIDNNLVGGLRYSLVDMSLRGGLGDVVAGSKAIRLPTPTLSSKVTEKLTAALHSNGRDYWIVVHGWQSNSFYSFLLSPTGISPTPVVSSVGPVHSGGGGAFAAANAVGYMKISPLGTHLALAQRDRQFELYTFNNATGSVSNYVPLSLVAERYNGIEFSPDNSRLYTSTYTLGGGFTSTIHQYNLLAGSAAAINTSRQTVANLSGLSVGLQWAPDSKIYIASYDRPFLHVISSPNGLGAASGFSQDAVSLGPKVAQIGLPNFPNQFAQPAITAAISVAPVCLGTAASFSVAISPGSPAAAVTWNFGDPASGAANTGTGLTPTHTYTAAGTYTATATVTLPGAAPITTTATVTVNPLPTVSLGAATQQICPGQSLTLTAGPQPAGSTYRWQDASTGSSFAVTQPGTYSVTVTSPQGCSAQATTTVTAQPAPTVRLGADTVVCEDKPLRLQVNQQPAGATYRWQDGSTSSTFVVQTAGTYAVEVTLPGGCTGRDEIMVRAAQCPFKIPNVITPNSDNRNDAFVLEGLNPRSWRIEIYNRWGRQVYQKEAYDNGWNAANESAGVYYYLLTHGTTGQRYRGYVEVIR